MLRLGNVRAPNASLRSRRSRRKLLSFQDLEDLGAIVSTRPAPGVHSAVILNAPRIDHREEPPVRRAKTKRPLNSKSSRNGSSHRTATTPIKVKARINGKLHLNGKAKSGEA